MSAKIINVKNLVKADVIATRDTATTIINEVPKQYFSPVQVDFTGVQAVSRSFMNQLLHEIKASKKKIRLIGMNDSIESMLTIVRDYRPNKASVKQDIVIEYAN